MFYLVLGMNSKLCVGWANILPTEPFLHPEYVVRGSTWFAAIPCRMVMSHPTSFFAGLNQDFTRVRQVMWSTELHLEPLSILFCTV